MQDVKENHIHTNDHRLTLVQSYIAWWNMAGMDHNVDSCVINWLDKKTIKTPKNIEITSQSQTNRNIDLRNNPQSQASLRAINTPHDSDSIANREIWPKSISEMIVTLEKRGTLPGNGYSDIIIPPRYLLTPEDGPSQKTIMVISDFPSKGDEAKKTLLSGKEEQLIVNMLTAAGQEKNRIFCTSLAHTRPIYDELPAPDLPIIHSFIRHQIEILDPDIIISLGSTVCNALLGAELMKCRDSLHYFNYNNKDRTLLTTFHPKSLLAKPLLKRKAWRDLQLLIKKDIL